MTPPAGDAAYGAAGNAAVGYTSRSSSLNAWVSRPTNPRHVTGRGKIAAADHGSSSTSTGRRDLMHEWEPETAFHLSDPKPPPRVKRSNAPRPDRLWRERVLERDQGCCVHTSPADCDEGLQAHHVVAQQELRRTKPEALWNPLSGMGVCGLAHRQHHSRIRPIPLKAVPTAVAEYLVSVGFGGYLERRYL